MAYKGFCLPLPLYTNITTMAQIEVLLSSKIQKETNMAEVLIRFFLGKKFNLRAKTGIFVSPDYFEYFINREKSEKMGVKVPANLLSVTMSKAKEKNYAIRDSG